MARGCQIGPPKVPAPQGIRSKAGNRIPTPLALKQRRGRCHYVAYSERTILPGGVPVEKGEPAITLGAPVEEL